MPGINFVCVCVRLRQYYSCMCICVQLRICICLCLGNCVAVPPTRIISNISPPLIHSQPTQSCAAILQNPSLVPPYYHHRDVKDGRDVVDGSGALQQHSPLHRLTPLPPPFPPSQHNSMISDNLLKVAQPGGCVCACVCVCVCQCCSAVVLLCMLLYIYWPVDIKL